MTVETCDGSLGNSSLATRMTRKDSSPQIAFGSRLITRSRVRRGAAFITFGFILAGGFVFSLRYESRRPGRDAGQTTVEFNGSSRPATMAVLLALPPNEIGSLDTLQAQETTRPNADTNRIPSEAALQGVVYKHLVSAHIASPSASRHFGAFFLEAQKPHIAYLKTLFTNSAPRIEFGTNNLRITKTGVTDALTKKPATLFWSRLKSVSNDVATVDAGWTSGPETGGMFQYHLIHKGGFWIVSNRARQALW